MKKLVSILSILFALNLSAQSITIPVNRVSAVSNDSTLFNFRPYTVQLNVIGGASFGFTNFYYAINDSIAANTPHLTPFGQPFTRSSKIEGNISLPNSVFYGAFDSTNKPNISVFNQILGFMDMQCDTLRTFIIR